MTNQGNEPPASSTAQAKDAGSLASEFDSLPTDYQNIIRLAQQQHGIRIVPLQELKGGFTGAVLFLVSVSTSGSRIVEHLVLKLDRPWPGEPDELHRHSNALEQAPADFASEHMADIAFDRVEVDGTIAILYRIAGESLHGYRPLGAFQRQSQLETIFSVVNREILARWNSVAASFEQAVHPQSLLPRWLTYRLKPQGSIEKFLEKDYRIDAGRPGLLIQGRVYPNPLLFAREASQWGRARLIDAVVGYQHGDMNVNNILVKFGEDEAKLEGYYLIDFAMFEEGMPLLYDQAYLEMSFLLPYVSTVDFPKWVELVTAFADRDFLDPQLVPIELAGAAAAINAGRHEFDRWVQENHISLTDDLWGQFWLAATAAGLNYSGKGGLSNQQRLAGLIFAASHLKRYSEKFNVPLPVDVAHLYEASHLGEEPKGAMVVRRRSGPEQKHNLPVQLTSFIGREDEIQEINSLLSKVRLVTLTGSGGSGKSRLAQEIGSSNLDAYPDGVWFVGLAPLSDPKLIVEEVSSVLGVGEEALDDYLEDKSTLLILDNCEHMVDGCAEFASTLLQRAHNVRVLATSQEALGIAGETVHRVPSLSVPDSPQSPVETLTDCAAVRLFVERAATVQPGFTLTDKNAAAVTQITRSLDGIPLAIELAAARTNVLSAEQIADRLDDAFRLLTRGRRTDLPRHQTLRGTVEWSYQLLSEPECLLFDQLSVFRGGLTLEAAEEVCSGDRLESYEVLDVLSQLVDKSLVVVEEGPGGEARYRLLEVLRLYGTERLAETGRTEDVHGRHAAFFLSMAERAQPELFGSQQVAWLNRLESDYDNFRAAMAWALESDHTETAIKIASALTWFWISHRHVNDGQDWLERAAMHSGDASPTVRAIGLARAAMLHAKKLKDFERLYGWLEESSRLCQEAQWNEGTVEVLWVEGVIAWFEGEFERMSKCFEELGPLLEGAEHTPMMDAFMGVIHWFQGSAAASHGDNQHANDLFEQALASARKAGGHFFVAYFLFNLGGRSLDHGDYERAASLYTESLPLFQDINDLTGVGCALAGLGTAAWLQGDHDQALKLHQESLANFKDSREGSSIAFCLACLNAGIHPPGGLQGLVDRHNERLDLPPEEWSKEVIAEAVHRSGTAV